MPAAAPTPSAGKPPACARKRGRFPRWNFRLIHTLTSREILSPMQGLKFPLTLNPGLCPGLSSVGLAALRNQRLSAPVSVWSFGVPCVLLRRKQSVPIGVHPWVKCFAPSRLCVEPEFRRCIRETRERGSSNPATVPAGNGFNPMRILFSAFASFGVFRGPRFGFRIRRICG